MRKYETLKWLKRLFLVVGGIALIMLLFMLVLGVSTRGREGENEKAVETAVEKLPVPSSAAPIVHVTDLGDKGKMADVDEEYYDLGARLKNDDGESLMASGAAVFADEYAAAVSRKNDDFLIISLNREVIEKYGFKLDEDVFLGKSYAEWAAIGEEPKCLLTAMYSITGSDGRQVKYTYAVENIDAADLEYDLAASRIRNCTLYFDGAGKVVSYLPFPEYMIAQYAAQYGLVSTDR